MAYAAAASADPVSTTPVHGAIDHVDDRSVVDAPRSGGSFGGKLMRFTERVLRKASSPLLPTRVHDSPVPKTPLRSKRIAAQPLAKVPVARRGEALVMQRMGLTQGKAVPTDSAQQIYDSMFVDKLKPSHAEAMKELFLDAARTARPKRRGAARA